MPYAEDVYTISESNVLDTIPKEMKRRNNKVAPDGRPSVSVRGSSLAGGAHPLKASTLSLFVWGSGQIYNRQGQLGLLMLLTQALAVAAHWSLSRLWPSVREMADLFGYRELRVMEMVGAADFLVLLVMLFNVHQAYRRAEAEAGGYDGSGNPVLSGLASMLVPGWGQLTNAQPGKAMVFLFCFLSGAYVLAIATLTPFVKVLSASDPSGKLTHDATFVIMTTLGVAAVMWVLSVYDAVLVASFRRRMA